MDILSTINQKQFAYWPVKGLKVKGHNVVYEWIWAKNYFSFGEVTAWVDGRLQTFIDIPILYKNI